MHFHVGLRGDRRPEWGHISERMRALRPVYDIFLLYAGVPRGQDTDDVLEQNTLRQIDGATDVDRVVCLALDHVWDPAGQPRSDLSDFWVSNDYVRHLRRLRPERVLFGASVHPYRCDFKDRVSEAVDQGAVLLKWLPSAQQFSLAEPRVREALVFLATAKGGAPLPVLLHTGVEYAVPTTDERTRPWDYLSWGFWDRFANYWRRSKWYLPDIPGVRQTLDRALDAGAVIILAHAGLPYFAAKAALLEHDDLPVVTEYLRRGPAVPSGAGLALADLSACATPFRRGYFKDLARLPADRLLFGSDFPTPVFELRADLAGAWRDFKAMVAGDFWRIVVPRDNPVNVNYRQLNHYFPGHPMFTNFAQRFLALDDRHPPEAG